MSAVSREHCPAGNYTHASENYHNTSSAHRVSTRHCEVNLKDTTVFNGASPWVPPTYTLAHKKVGEGLLTVLESHCTPSPLSPTIFYLFGFENLIHDQAIKIEQRRATLQNFPTNSTTVYKQKPAQLLEHISIHSAMHTRSLHCS